MLKEFYRPKKPEADELEQRLEEAQARIAANQLRLREAKVPVIVMLEGVRASGKGSVITRIIKDMDPRFFRVANMHDSPSEDERRRPFLWRYLVEIPEEGHLTFFNNCWMTGIVREQFTGAIDEERYEQRIESVNTAERHLVDNGYLVCKFFLYIGRGEQRRRLDALASNPDTSWRVSESDFDENDQYNTYIKAFDRYLRNTNRSSAPWYIIDAKSRKWATLQVLEFLNDSIEVAIHNRGIAAPLRQNVFPLAHLPKLSEIDLTDKTLEEMEYREELKRLRTRLHELHNAIYRRHIPVVICYEGWDAAGKGGNIKRLTTALDPRGYEVIPIASPEPHEKARYYLWRFWQRIPKTGHITIFDRTWYGRVMVERLEGFCTENDWRRAYVEINEFERELTDEGVVVVKFWVQIDQDTQLARFTDRQNTPEKQWKITDEDWRNREKWDLYEQAVDEMLLKTSTMHAPWHILESNDKRYARIKALSIVVDAIESACARYDAAQAPTEDVASDADKEKGKDKEKEKGKDKE